MALDTQEILISCILVGSVVVIMTVILCCCVGKDAHLADDTPLLGFEYHHMDEEQGGANFDDCYWDELPAEAKAAANILGYSKAIWDGSDSKQPATYVLCWDELEPAQQQAAVLIGYTESTWDQE